MTHRTVFILGAGASKEAGAPLMREFLDVADVVRETHAGGSTLREQFDLVFRAIAELDPVFAKSTIDVDNIESIFAAFEMVGWPTFAPLFFAQVGSRGLMQCRASISSSPVPTEIQDLASIRRTHGSQAG